LRIIGHADLFLPEGASRQVIAQRHAVARRQSGSDRRQQSFVWNATNITRALRTALIDLFGAYHARIRIVYVDAPWDAILRRNQERESSVPEPVIARMLRKLEVPDLTEAHAVNWIWRE
jgi:predicted kinase